MSTIEDVKALRTGHVALQLSDGRVIALCAEREDVRLRAADRMKEVVDYVEQEAIKDWYIVEPTPEDAASVASARLFPRSPGSIRTAPNALLD